jgi:microcompartment protein CcmK/EutM
LAGLQLNTPDGEELVAWDQLGTGLGTMVGISEGGEATQPFKPKKVPLDCYCSCIVAAEQPSPLRGSKQSNNQTRG